MVDSFFVDPSKRKRKRATTSTVPRSSRTQQQQKSGLGSSRRALNKNYDNHRNNHGNSTRKQHVDEEITSGSDVSMDEDEGEGNDVSDLDTSLSDDDLNGSGNDSDDDTANETEADKRRRLAKDYLDSLREDIDDAGAFDAEDLDREIISRRLKDDVAEQEGRVYRFFEDLNWSRVSESDGTVHLHQAKPYGMTSVAVHYPFAYTVSKDLYLSKWDISNLTNNTNNKLKLVKFARGNHKMRSRLKKGGDPAATEYMQHFDEILCCCVNYNGQYVVTGGRDHRIIVWSTENLTPLKVFDTKDRRGVVLGLCFRRNSNDLYASCADLKVRSYNLDQLAQVETLFGHQDQVCDISALGQERCITVGSRDRTAMLWKINEESRLIFRGGGSSSDRIMEGSIDCCSMIDDQLFVTGSDNGSICLWSTNKKRPIYIQREAHERDYSMNMTEYTADTALIAGNTVTSPEPQARYITSIYAIPYSDLFFSGSWSGDVRVWKLSPDLRSFSLQHIIPGFPGVVNRIAVVESGPKNKENLTIVAAVSKEMRLGRWMKTKSGKNGLVTAQVYRK